jgi:uncharacterized protein (DUF1778 family)
MNHNSREKKTSVVIVRLTQTERERLTKAATAAGTTLSGLMRTATFSKIETLSIT